MEGLCRKGGTSSLAACAPCYLKKVPLVNTPECVICFRIHVLWIELVEGAVHPHGELVIELADGCPQRHIRLQAADQLQESQRVGGE